MTTTIMTTADNQLATQDMFGKSIDIVLGTLSETSQRVYGRTYRAWVEFAHNNGFDAMSLTFENVRMFIQQGRLTRTTRQNRLSHMRKLLELLAIGNSDYKPHYDAVKSFLKVKTTADDKARSGRNKRALSPHEATQFLAVWDKDTSPLGLRNNAMMRLLIYTGLRRSELVALKWTDINLEDMTLTVQHGKGDKARVVAIVDPSAKTSTTLDDLRIAQGYAYNHVFPSLTRGKSSRFADDTPCSDKTIDRVVKATADKADLGDLAPHDLRRTHITEGLNAGATVADMQAQAGHVNASTTLRYAQATDAIKRRDRIAFRFA